MKLFIFIILHYANTNITKFMAGSKGSKYYNIFLKYKLWLSTSENEEIISDEAFCLLCEIKNTFSIKDAAERLNISYRKAWGILRDIESKLKFNVVIKHRGGEKGGKTELSEDGLCLITAYIELTQEMNDSINRITKKFFHAINKNNTDITK